MAPPTSLARKLLFAAVPLVVMLGAMEVLARVALQGTDTALEVGGPLGWTMRPDLDNYLVTQPRPKEDFRVSSNADGLRTTLPRERTPGVPRIALLGESTIFGWGVAEDGSLPAATQAVIGDGWEVLNAGQPGFSTFQSARLAEAVVPAYQPDIFVVFVSWNDERQELPDSQTLPRHPASLTSTSGWSRLAMVRWVKARRAYRDAAHFETSGSPLASRPRAPDLGGSIRCDPADRLEAMQDLAKLAEETGKTLVIALLPAGNKGTEAVASSPFSAETAELAAQVGYDLLNLEGSLTRLSPQLANTPGDKAHYTPLANRELARHFVAELRSRGLLDSVASAASGG